MYYNNLLWYDSLPSDWVAYAIYALDGWLVELRDLQNGSLKSFHSGTHFEWLDRHIKENIMPRGKTKNNENASPTPKRPTGNCKWINVRLSDEDILDLSERQFAAEDLLGWMLELSRGGADVGVKWADEGQSRMAYCIVPDSESGKVLLGISAYGADAFDALCALVYKIDIKLERIFTAPDDAAKPRFR